jgi:hypothetical protein
MTPSLTVHPAADLADLVVREPIGSALPELLAG